MKYSIANEMMAIEIDACSRLVLSTELRTYYSAIFSAFVLMGVPAKLNIFR
ncbi:hypothetical protein [Herminiimonas arsenitoxidans]|uniref:hypothetical protein n=1 Tax=Herminiimonas arsenitoxidans TaxID=1809410 RepID=UPI00138FF3DB|nr:hypothetical protein [Herminiimonas arsenitoxidans]